MFARGRGYAHGMTNSDASSSPTDSSAAKDPDRWVTGDEPATGPQRSYVETLAQDTGTEVPDELTKAEASKLIDELQDQSPRVGD